PTPRRSPGRRERALVPLRVRAVLRGALDRAARAGPLVPSATQDRLGRGGTPAARGAGVLAARSAPLPRARERRVPPPPQAAPQRARLRGRGAEGPGGRGAPDRGHRSGAPSGGALGRRMDRPRAGARVTRAVRLVAPAKVNLSLEILGVRDDGYHALRSVVATIDLADRVRVAISKRLDVRVRPDPGAAPEAELTRRAVEALA